MHLVNFTSTVPSEFRGLRLKDLKVSTDRVRNQANSIYMIGMSVHVYTCAECMRDLPLNVQYLGA